MATGGFIELCIVRTPTSASFSFVACFSASLASLRASCIAMAYAVHSWTEAPASGGVAMTLEQLLLELSESTNCPPVAGKLFWR